MPFICSCLRFSSFFFFFNSVMNEEWARFVSFLWYFMVSLWYSRIDCLNIVIKLNKRAIFRYIFRNPSISKLDKTFKVGNAIYPCYFYPEIPEYPIMNVITVNQRSNFPRKWSFFFHVSCHVYAIRYDKICWAFQFTRRRSRKYIGDYKLSCGSSIFDLSIIEEWQQHVGESTIDFVENSAMRFQLLQLKKVDNKLAKLIPGYEG